MYDLVELIDQGYTEILYNSNECQAIISVYDIWNKLDPDIVHNCSVKTGITIDEK